MGVAVHANAVVAVQVRAAAQILLAAWACASLEASTAHASQKSASDPVAIVVSVSGEAWAKPPSAASKRVQLFERLGEGTRLELKPQSRLLLVFANGRRFDLQGQAAATLGKDDLQKVSGTLRRLAPVPPLPSFLPIEEAGKGTAAVRVRGLLRCLYPRDAALIPDQAVLRFSAAPNGGSCTVEVENESGERIFAVETRSTEVALPGGVLLPGARFIWRVRCRDATGTTVRAEARFITLRTEQLAARSELRAALEGSDDVTSLVLLAEVDRRLGLLNEARLAFKSAAARSPDDVPLRNALAEVERRLAGN